MGDDKWGRSLYGEFMTPNPFVVPRLQAPMVTPTLHGCLFHSSAGSSTISRSGGGATLISPAYAGNTAGRASMAPYEAHEK